MDEQATELFGQAVGGAQRMYQMVDCLHAYARVQSKSNLLRPVDAGTILDDALTDLALGIQESEVEVVREGLPTVAADPHQLARNLITNAMEHSGDDPPRIRVDAEPAEGMWRFSVRDEGVGIPPEHAGEVFDVFRRLGEAEDSDGLGSAWRSARRSSNATAGASGSRASRARGRPSSSRCRSPRMPRR